MVKKVLTKTLDKKEFELEEAYPSSFYAQKKKHEPAVIIKPFVSFGIGSRLKFKESDLTTTSVEIGGQLFEDGAASVTAFYQDPKNPDKIIIEAEKNIHKEEKMKFVNKIVKKINLEGSLKDEMFIKILSRVFTDKQLEQFIKEDDLEIILFEGLMYLKVGKKAYRL